MLFSSTSGQNKLLALQAKREEREMRLAQERDEKKLPTLVVLYHATPTPEPRLSKPVEQ
jgi:hypothetical protein